MAKDGNAERLVVLLEARVNQFEKSMAKASGTATKSYGKMRRGSRTATRQMEKDMMRSTTRINRALTLTSTKIGTLTKGGFGGLGVGALAAVAPILSVGAALRKAMAALDEFDRIAKAARNTGLDGEFYQALAYQADLAGVSVGQLDQALIAFIRKVGEAAVGNGDLVEKLRLLNPELLKAIQGAKSQEESLRLMAEAVQQAETATEKAALASAAFGRNGAILVQVLDKGSDGFDEMAVKARELGIVIDRDLLASSETLKDELTTATKIMDLEFGRALIDLVPILISVANLAGAVAKAITGISDAMRELGDRSTRSLEQELKRLAATRMQPSTSFSAVNPNESPIEKDIKAELRRRALVKLAEQLDGLRAPVKPLADTELDTGTGTESRTNQTEAALKQAEAVRKLVGDLQFEREQLGRNAADQELYNTLKQAGVERTSDFGQAIEANVQALQAERDALAASQAMLDLARETTRSFISDLMAGQKAGKSFWDSFADAGLRAIDQISQRLLDSAINGLFDSLMPTSTGPINLNNNPAGGLDIMSLLKTVMGFADGTANTGGRRGEPRGVVHGQEAVIPLPAGGKVPVEITGPAKSAGSSGGGRIDVRVISEVRNGNLVPVMTEISGQVAGQAIRQSVPAMIDAQAPVATAVASRAFRL
jgi:hypothetical protein